MKAVISSGLIDRVSIASRWMRSRMEGAVEDLDHGGWPNISPKPLASIRAKVSDAPPGLVGEMIRTGFVGRSAANAKGDPTIPRATSAMAKMRWFILAFLTI